MCQLQTLGCINRLGFLAVVVRLYGSGEQRSETRERQLALVTPDIGYQVNLICVQTSVLARQEGVQLAITIAFGPRHTSHRDLVGQVTCLNVPSTDGASQAASSTAKPF